MPTPLCVCSIAAATFGLMAGQNETSHAQRSTSSLALTHPHSLTSTTPAPSIPPCPHSHPYITTLTTRTPFAQSHTHPLTLSLTSTMCTPSVAPHPHSHPDTTTPPLSPLLPPPPLPQRWCGTDSGEEQVGVQPRRTRGHHHRLRHLPIRLRARWRKNKGER